MNANNSMFRVRQAQPTSGLGFGFGFLTNRNNTTLNALATDFATQLGNTIKSAQGLANTVTVAASAITPSSTTTIGGDSDHIISFTLTFSANHNITNANGNNPCVCQFFTQNGEAYELLGGDRIDDLTDSTQHQVLQSMPLVPPLCQCSAYTQPNVTPSPMSTCVPEDSPVPP